MSVTVPTYAADAIAGLLQKLDEHRQVRPNAIRSWPEAFGLIAEEHHELIRQLTKSKVDDPKTDKLLNDCLELAMVSISAYIDLCPSAAPAVVPRQPEAATPPARSASRMCARCRRHPGTHEIGNQLVCEECCV